MKKIPVLVFLLILSSNSSAIAIPSFGTLMPDAGKFQGGSRTDIIFERDVKDYNSAKTNTYYYTCSYGFTEWFSVDALVGLGNVRSERIYEKELRYPFHFSGGYGWRAKLYKNEKYGVDWVCGFQHVSTHPGRQWYEGRKYSIIWDDWQVSTVLSKEFWNFKPYVGMKYSFIYLISKINYNRNRRISTSAPIGLVAGTDLRVNDYLYLNVEGRFFDETALNAGFTVKY